MTEKQDATEGWARGHMCCVGRKSKPVEKEESHREKTFKSNQADLLAKGLSQ